MPLHVPHFLVHPIALHYVDDETHVIAYFNGHAEYECVEAMFSSRGDGTFSARAILTRRDQAQIDFVNDRALLAPGSAPGRTRVLADVDVVLGEERGLPVAEVRFESRQGEPIVLRLACASPPDRSRGGLTDPGSHALGSSLPMMWRDASALAGPASSVHIAGVRHPIPENMRKGPHFVAHHGYFTRGFRMAAFRNGSRSFRILRRPTTFQVGEQWVYDTALGELAYEIQAKDDDQVLRIVSPAGRVETVDAVATADGLALRKIVLPACRSQCEGPTIAFDPPGRFSIGVDAQPDHVAGSTRAPGRNSVVLQPDHPAWAVARPVHIAWSLEGDVVTIETVCADRTHWPPGTTMVQGSGQDWTSG